MLEFGQRRNHATQINDAKSISNQLFVNIVKYGKLVQLLYSQQLREKYGSLYNDFLALEKDLNKQLENKK